MAFGNNFTRLISNVGCHHFAKKLSMHCISCNFYYFVDNILFSSQIYYKSVFGYSLCAPVHRLVIRVNADYFWEYLFYEASWDYRDVIRVVGGRVLNRLICDLMLLVDTGVLLASRNVHYDEIDYKVTSCLEPNFKHQILLVS